MAFELIRNIGAAGCMLVSAYCAGHLLSPLLRSVSDGVLRAILILCLGFALLSYGVVLLDSLHFLQPSGIWILLLFFVAVRFSVLKQGWQDLCSVSRSLWDSTTAVEKILRLIFLLSAFSLLAGALAPEIGGDSLVYHLNLPKLFLSQASLKPLEFDLNSYMPLFMYNLYLIALAVSGAVTAKLISFVLGFLLFLLLRQVIFQETAHRTLSLFFALIFWLTPTVFNMISTTYVDTSLALYSFCALVLLLSGIRQGAIRLFLASGLFLGFDMSIKYLAMISFAGIVAVLVVTAVMHSGKAGFLLKAGAVWLTGFVLGCGYWLVRNWLLVGNPVYPYLSNLFGADSYAGYHFEHWGMGKSLGSYLLVFWNMFFHPQNFGSFGTRTGIFYFFLLPFSVIAAWKRPGMRMYFVYLMVFLTAWFLICQAHRYVIPLLPVLLLTAASGFQWFYSIRFKPAVHTVRLGIVSSGFLILMVYLLAGLYHYRYEYLIYLGRWSPSVFLTKMERAYPAAQWVNQNLPQNALLLMESEVRQFYFDRPLIRNNFFMHRTQYGKKALNGAALAELLKENGITHFLARNLVVPNQSPKPEGILRSLLPEPFSRRIATIESQNIRDEKYVYEVYELAV